MRLQTQIPLSKESRNPISYDSQLLLLGSCFSVNMAKLFDYFKFRTLVNPFGILFQVTAIEKLILYAVNQKNFSEEDIFYHNEQWHSFDAHSSLNSKDKEELLDRLNTAVHSTYNQLLQSTHIVLTLGTAWVYRHIESDNLVANCHKVSQKKFLKELLSIDDIRESLEASISLIRSVNKDASFVLTVSPVRHLKDGFIENQQSKAHLISALHQLVNPKKGIHYFPSYEMVMDELRDYRFYEQDMIHPNKIAIQYIWERFSENWFTEDTLSSAELIDKIQKGLNHKPFNPISKSHQAFLKVLNHQISEIQNKHPHIKFK